MFLKAGKHLLQICRADSLLHNRRAGHAAQGQRGIHDDPREAHATAGGVEQVGIQGGGALHYFTGSLQQ